jgi:hypothetical protein
MNIMGRKEFNYLVILIILIYIFDSAINIIQEGMEYLDIILYLTVLLNLLFFSFNTFKVLRTQMEVIQETGMDLLIPTVIKKKTLLLGFVVLFLGYFVGEFLIHFYLINFIVESEVSIYKKAALILLIHEIVEICSIGGIFYLYRAREMGAFFNVDFDTTPNFRVLPFYESKQDCNEGFILTVVLPSNKIMLGKLD